MDIPITWKATLAIVQRLSPGAVIAGGCLRDLDNDRRPKDIDIFVAPVPSGLHRIGIDDLKSLRSRLMQLGVDCCEIDSAKSYPVGLGHSVVGFFEAEFPGLATPAQIIMVEHDLNRITDRIDYGICRIAFDGVKVITTSDYARDKANEVFRMCQPRYGAELSASVHRYARLVSKYPGWRWEAYTEEDIFA